MYPSPQPTQPAPVLSAELLAWLRTRPEPGEIERYAMQLAPSHPRTSEALMAFSRAVLRERADAMTREFLTHDPSPEAIERFADAWGRALPGFADELRERARLERERLTREQNEGAEVEGVEATRAQPVEVATEAQGAEDVEVSEASVAIATSTTALALAAGAEGTSAATVAAPTAAEPGKLHRVTPFTAAELADVGVPSTPRGEPRSLVDRMPIARMRAELAQEARDGAVVRAELHARECARVDRKGQLDLQRTEAQTRAACVEAERKAWELEAAREDRAIERELLPHRIYTERVKTEIELRREERADRREERLERQQGWQGWLGLLTSLGGIGFGLYAWLSRPPRVQYVPVHAPHERAPLRLGAGDVSEDDDRPRRRRR